MSACTADEIAEKKRIALERLKARKAQTTGNDTGSNQKPRTTGAGEPAKNSSPQALKFYSKLGQSQNNGSDFLRAVHETKSALHQSTEARASTHPYQRPSTSPGSKSVFKNVVENNNNKIAPVFVQTVNCTCSLVSETRFAVATSSYHSKLIEVFKSIPSKAYEPDEKLWTFALKDYNLIQERVGAMKPYIVIGTIPKNVLTLCSQPKETLTYSCLSTLEPKLQAKLLPFQREGVCFGISKHGRVMIADEMGLGKTYQALSIADFYRDDWPLLICTTASTRDSWATHVRELLPYVACHHIAVLTANQQYFGDAKVLITSYNMMERNIDKLLERYFGFLIMDESHTLKNNKAKCTVMADRLARQARRVVLLSGTPALSRPVELFTQLQMIDRSFFNYKDYTTRYCAGKQGAFGWDASGQSNLKELQIVLRRKFMIRRVKADVLPELAEKNRETVVLDPSLLWTSDDTMENLTTYAEDFSKSKGREKEALLLRFYAETAAVKAKAVCAYLKTVVKEKTKFIVFAHHKVLMDAISNCLTRLNVDFVRIDGSTRNDARSEYVERFQKKASCQVAVLSLKACNAGITLTAAQMIVFAELDWNPSTLAQAESRAHRIGQESTVTCRYLLAHKTADDVIWNMLKTKQDVLNKAGLFCEDLQDAEHTIAPVSAPKIDKYLQKTESTDKRNSIQKPALTGTPSTKVPHPASATKVEASVVSEFASLLDDGDEDFTNLDF